MLTRRLFLFRWQTEDLGVRSGRRGLCSAGVHRLHDVLSVVRHRNCSSPLLLTSRSFTLHSSIHAFVHSFNPFEVKPLFPSWIFNPGFILCKSSNHLIHHFPLSYFLPSICFRRSSLPCPPALPPSQAGVTSPVRRRRRRRRVGGRPASARPPTRCTGCSGGTARPRPIPVPTARAG